MIEQPFYGEIALLGWHPHWDGNQYRTIVGMITIHHDRDLLGWAMRGGDSNWLAEVSGDDDVIYIPGCKIAHLARLGKRLSYAPGDTLSLTTTDRREWVKQDELARGVLSPLTASSTPAPSANGGKG